MLKDSVGTEAMGLLAYIRLIPALVFALAMAVWYFTVYFRAELPRAGTLEWITVSRPTALQPPRTSLLCDTDAVWALIPMTCAFFVWFAAYAVYYFYLDIGVSLPVLLLYAAEDGFLASLGQVLTAAAAYLLCKILTGRTAASVGGAVLLAIRYPSVTNPMLPLLLCLLLLRLWMAEEPGSVPAVLAFLGTHFFFGILVYLDPALLPGLLLLLGCILYEGISRREKPWRIALQMCLSVLLSAVFLLLTLLPWTLQGGEPLMQTVFSAEFFRRIFSWTLHPISALRLADFRLYEHLLTKLESALLTLGFLPALCMAFVRRRDFDAPWLFFTVLGLTVLLFFGFADYLPVTGALALGWLSARLEERGKPFPAALGIAGSLSSALATVVYSIFG